MDRATIGPAAAIEELWQELYQAQALGTRQQFAFQIEEAQLELRNGAITDATGIPLAATPTGGNRNDVTRLIPLLQAVPPVRGKLGRPRRRPDVVLGDRGHDHDEYRRLVWDLGVKPLIARRGTSTAPDLAPNPGSSSARSPICTGSAACGSAGRYATTSTKPNSFSTAHTERLSLQRVVRVRGLRRVRRTGFIETSA
ncbi:transposase [Streptomyces sp. NBC_01235]|uniref:transposase n=1 Tax=Streptomyces sp. NBC_01235 TaxID=2903788 RepID=UPI002E0EE195|nr:transposase [Streptomyces sp. NBC_01235]